ncbi:hypothetical protein NW768_008718 [Fusarium equiseti]|uniref:Uncharacterized protein n=1 Tax=Fusarium equiseti TaxID=61235 RepID=A0ABQ8R4S4_FUSEQ|nr:hypothetical protein NW768_008718 [Fusarium equiseti]
MFQLICPSVQRKAATAPGSGSQMDASGQSNMYMQNHRCKVTGSTSTKKLGKPKPAVYCRDNPTKCVPGPKQMMVWNQAEGNNVNPPDGKTPTYNQRMGFMDGAQDDIFATE